MVAMEELIGAWRMVDWRVFVGSESDPHLPPLGVAADCGGILIYSADGMMSAMLSRRARRTFADSSLDGGSPSEKAQAFEEALAYAGTFEFDPETAVVTHVVEHATHPNLVGQRMRRICVIEDGRLKLDTPSMMMGGISRASYIRWERHSDWAGPAPV